ncbi:MAG: helix-turn-helix transcriptional regulator [Raoultibacter sp.]
MLGFQRVKTMMQDKTVPLCLVAIFFISLSGSFLNAEVYARIAPYFGIGREISTFFSAALFLVVAFAAVKKPSIFDVRQISIVVVTLLIASIFLLTLALEMESAPFVMLGLFCRAIGQVWAITVFSVALTTIASTRIVLLTVGLGTMLAGFFWQLVPAGLPLIISCAAVMLCAIVPIVLMWRLSIPQFTPIQQSATASGLGVSQFSGFGKLKNLFFCMMLFSIASGYALTFNEESNAPITTVIESVVLALIVLFVLLSKGESEAVGKEDQLFSFAALLIVAGFLIAPFSFGLDTSITNGLLRAGRDCFSLLIWLVLASIGHRNIFMLLPILGSVRFMSGIGTDIGAIAGRTTNSLITEAPLAAEALTAAFVFAFIAFLWLGFRDFSFARVINGVKAITAPEIKQIGDHIEARCREIGMREGLTEREIDILGLLAKGRDGKFIAEEYVLSYNTVKTHIKHIYQKLGVHSRQELIDLVGAV